MSISIRAKLYLTTVISAAIAISCSSGDDRESTSDLVDYTDASSTDTLALSNALSADIPETLATAESAALVADPVEKNQCDLYIAASRLADHVQRTGAHLCRFEAHGVELPETVGDSLRYALVFAKHPHEKTETRGERVTRKGPRGGAAAATALTAATPFTLHVQTTFTSEDADNDSKTYGYHICAKGGERRWIASVTTSKDADGNPVREGWIDARGTKRGTEVTYSSITHFASKLALNSDAEETVLHNILEMYRFAEKDTEKRAAFTRLEVDTVNDISKVFHSVNLDSNGGDGNWGGKKPIAGATKYAIAGIIDDANEEANSVLYNGTSGEFFLSPFGKDGAAIVEADLTKADDISIADSDIPEILADDDDIEDFQETAHTEDDNDACGFTADDANVVKIEVTKASVDAAAACAITKFSEPNCNDSAKFDPPSSATTGFSASGFAPKERTPPSL